MVQFRFESIFPVVVLSLVLVGLPAVILKQAAIWFLRGADGPRLRLLWASIGGSGASGIATILFHAWLSSHHALNAGSVGVPWIEPVTALLLLAFIGVADGMLWRRFTEIHGAQSPRSAALWLAGGNLWLPWALLLMHLWGLNGGFVD